MERRLLSSTSPTFALVLTLLLISQPRTASAGLSACFTWEKESADGKYLLVMISPVTSPDALERDLRDERRRAIRAKYSQSGLYLNDGSTKPLWITPRYWGRVRDVYIFPDGHHAVVSPDEWYYSDHVASFYQDGIKLRTYRIGDLMPSLQARIAFNGGCMIGPRSNICDDESLTYTLTTTQGEQFVFDVTTGKLMRHTSYLPLAGGIVLLVMFAVPAGGFWWWYRQARRLELKASGIV
jgi:hypothetical protein